LATAARARGFEPRARSELRARLEARREEIESAVLTRIAAIADPSEVADPAYAEGLRRSVPAAIGFGLETVEAGESNDPPIPVDLLAQARLAARNGIPLDTVLRRYFAGYSLLGFFLIEEASRDRLLSGAELQRLTAAQAAFFDRLLAAVAEEHGREQGARADSTADRRRAERIERLLAGAPVDVGEIAYDFDGWHVGLAAAGAGAEHAVRELAAGLDCRLLLLPREEGVVWAWLGSRHRPKPAELLRALGPSPSEGAGEPVPSAIALGEPAEQLPGWRLTHRQATAALSVAERGPVSVVRYGDVALLASAMQDDLLATSLRCLYLDPLERERDGGSILRRTLLAYLDCECNSVSTAAALSVTRQTVNNRLRLIEERIGRPVRTCAAELEVALWLSRTRAVSSGQMIRPAIRHIA
jgi:hypothetical protein